MSLSPTDEFADYERWDRASFGPQAKTPDMLPREYAREAFKRGLAYEEKLGANPFKFGVIGYIADLVHAGNVMRNSIKSWCDRPWKGNFRLRGEKRL